MQNQNWIEQKTHGYTTNVVYENFSRKENKYLTKFAKSIPNTGGIFGKQDVKSTYVCKQKQGMCVL